MDSWPSFGASSQRAGVPSPAPVAPCADSMPIPGEAREKTRRGDESEVVGAEHVWRPTGGGAREEGIERLCLAFGRPHEEGFVHRGA